MPTIYTRQPRIFGFIVTVGLVVFAVYCYQQLEQLSRSISNMEQSMGGVIDEQGKKLKIVDQMFKFGQDLNEIRRFLYLPTTNYNFSDFTEKDDSNEAASGGELNSLLFSYVNKLGEQRSNEQTLHMLQPQIYDVLHSEESKALQEKGVSWSDWLQNETSFFIEGKLNGQIFVTYSLSFENNRITAMDFRGEQSFDSIDQFKNYFSQFLQNIDALIALKTRYDATRKSIQEIIQSSDIKTVLEKKRMEVSYPDFKNLDGVVLLKTLPDIQTADYRIEIGNKNQTFSDPATFQQTLLEQLNLLDASTASEKLVVQKKQELLEIFSDPAFQDFMKEKGLAVSSTPIDEADRIYFYITDKDGKRISAIAIEKGSGDVLVVDENGLNPRTLQEFLSDDDVKKKP